MTRAALLALALYASASASAATAETASGSFANSPVELLGAGVICEVELEGQREAPETVSGILNIVDQDREIDVATPRVPADLGLSFGVRAGLLPGTAIPGMVDIVVTHPPMGDRGVTVERWQAVMNAGETSINLFTFQHDFEMVQGPWLFQIVSEGEVLLQQPFEVTPSGTVPPVQQTCFSARIMS